MNLCRSLQEELAKGTHLPNYLVYLHPPSVPLNVYFGIHDNLPDFEVRLGQRKTFHMAFEKVDETKVIADQACSDEPDTLKHAFQVKLSNNKKENKILACSSPMVCS